MFRRSLWNALQNQTAALGTLAGMVTVTMTTAVVLTTATSTSTAVEDDHAPNETTTIHSSAIQHHCHHRHNNNNNKESFAQPPGTSLWKMNRLSWLSSHLPRLPQQAQPCLCEAPPETQHQSQPSRQRRQRTKKKKKKQRAATSSTPSASSPTFADKYYINPDDPPLGEGAYATVYLGVDRQTGEKVAVKRFPRPVTHATVFQREMRVLQYVLQFGGHPHICGLHDFFADDDSDADYQVVVDFVSGGEMFDHLINNGAYSEADAARLVREVASALAFLHGIGVVHNDLKPENIMLSTTKAADSVVKLVDFGSAFIPGLQPLDGVFTTAYASPETFTLPMGQRPQPAADMWALGVILYIMLNGVHPFEVKGGAATDEELEKRIRTNMYPPPIRNSPVTQHLSESAKELLARLMERDPTKRITAEEMLEHPWVLGETATTDRIAGSDERLKRIRAMKTKLQANFFHDAVIWSDNEADSRRRTSLLEQSFKRRYNSGPAPLVVDGDGRSNSSDGNSSDYKSDGSSIRSSGRDSGEGKDDDDLSMAEFHSVLAENMKHRFFPRNHIIYSEGDEGNHMYIIISGTIEVTTVHGSRAERSQGDFFGEGALLSPQKIRSGTIRCKTPVHVLEISRKYFEKYLASSELGLMLAVKEKDRIRKRNRAKMILKQQPNLTPREYVKGEYLFQAGKEDDDSIFVVDSGEVKVDVDGHQVMTVFKGNITGEYSAMTGRKRNCSAVCQTDRCTASSMSGYEFRKLMDSFPDAFLAMHDLSLRRDFKKAVVLRLKKEFPYTNPREAFDAVGPNEDDVLTIESIGRIMRDMDEDYTDAEILEVVKMMDLTNTGDVCFDEFCKVFVSDIRASVSI
uniref:cGMP-dependent protein kinase n=1 Tax=Amphora coffeiformis TaxID=265554 RepID=A0A7S3L0D0_9STRA